MDENQKKILLDAGLDCAMALNNFMNNENMLKKFLGKYVNETSFPNLEAAMRNDDREAALMAAHTHKSVCGTLGCGDLNKLIVEQEAAMRGGDWDKATQLMPAIIDSHAKIVEAIKTSGLA